MTKVDEQDAALVRDFGIVQGRGGQVDGGHGSSTGGKGFGDHVGRGSTTGVLSETISVHFWDDVLTLDGGKQIGDHKAHRLVVIEEVHLIGPATVGFQHIRLPRASHIAGNETSITVVVGHTDGVQIEDVDGVRVWTIERPLTKGVHTVTVNFKTVTEGWKTADSAIEFTATLKTAE